jgi:Fe-S-cluster containining protein
MTGNDMFAYLAEVALTDPVPCNGCTACCRSNSMVALRAEFGDDPNLYGDENLVWQMTEPGKPPELTLKRQTNGDCTFLRKGKCKIYDKRPAVCRSFDCRRAFAMIPEEHHEAVVQQKVFSRDILNAANERKATLKLLPVERVLIEQAAQQGLAAHLIGKQNR